MDSQTVTWNLDLYRRMLRIRSFEETAEKLHAKGEIAGSLHCTPGQEAAAVGACAALGIDDYMVGTHRSHGHIIAKGASLQRLMAELFGRRTGVCKGKGGSMHLSDFRIGSLGETSIVGSGFPVAVGAALGTQLKGEDRVTLCFFGDGASNEGTFHESMNLAAIWRLPVIFFCENNGYGVSTPASQVVAVADVASRAAGYGMPSAIVDGQDVQAVYQAVAAAVRVARRGGGPTLIEAKTYLYAEHSANMGRTFRQRSAEEIAYWNARDPIRLQRSMMLASSVEEQAIAEVDSQVAAEINDAVNFARQSPYPEPDEAYTDVYAHRPVRRQFDGV
ncbi:MAG: thiamine pyrophosphate-dependent dehydrogenase E1 component subunit alpha [Dehalococcoidia bacterium]